MTEMWAVATFSLVAGMVDDLRSRKVHNGLVLALIPVILAANFYFRGFDGAALGAGAFLLALIITIPLFMFRILGGGDVKLFSAFALCVDPNSMFYNLMYSMVWGVIFGLTRAALHSIVKKVFEGAAERLRQRGDEYAVRGDLLERASAHWLRHTAGSHMADQQIDLRLVRDNPGHESLSTTGQYLHVDDDRRHKETEEKHRIRW